MLALTMSAFAGGASMRSGVEVKGPERYPFRATTPVEIATKLAQGSHTARKLDAGSPLRQLSYEQFREIRFNSDRAVWRNEQVPFRLELLPAGFVYDTPVAVSIVENGMARDLSAPPGMFTLGPQVPKQLANQALPLSGFNVRTMLNSRGSWDEFLMFQGATFFRAVGKSGVYGLSARGLALRTAHPAGEEFPAFTRFWVERPAANARGIVIHAVLESESTTGAYKFSVLPGSETVIDVNATLFPRVTLDSVGIAPLSSMFLFDESVRTRIDDFRDEVHNSDGLQAVLASGEQIWRPLANPSQLQISVFTNTQPKLFGLVQRSRGSADYHDLDAQFERRPSAWVEPTSDWGPGALELIELPSNNENNDNIVTLWRPKDPIPAGQPYHFSYRMRWNSNPQASRGLGKARTTRTGPTQDGKRRIFVVDFTGVRYLEDMRVDAGTSTGKLSNVALRPNPINKGVRASFELDPGTADLAELRLRIMRNDRPVTETWLYRWTAG
jgi:glucans biosynthesis protein